MITPMCAGYPLAIPYPLPEQLCGKLPKLGMHVLNCSKRFGDRAPKTAAARMQRDLQIAEIYEGRGESECHRRSLV